MRTSALTEKEKKIWEAVMSTEMMSSEESDAGSNSDNESSSTLCKRPLPKSAQSQLDFQIGFLSETD